MSIWLTRAVPTHTRTWPRGQRFARAVWYEVDDIEVANLYDDRGELFGPGSAEQAPLWRAWLSSLQAAFPQEWSPA